MHVTSDDSTGGMEGPWPPSFFFGPRLATPSFLIDRVLGNDYLLQ